MRSMGIDVASRGWAAVGLVVDGEPRRFSLWKPSDAKSSHVVNIAEYYAWVRRQIWIMKPDVVAVEELAVFMNKNVIRSLSRHEGVSLLAAKQSGAIVINPPVTQSRGIVFKRGNISKDDAWPAFKKIFPDLKLPAKTSGGLDVMDAYTHGLAAPVILERR